MQWNGRYISIFLPMSLTEGDDDDEDCCWTNSLRIYLISKIRVSGAHFGVKDTVSLLIIVGIFFYQITNTQ